MSNAQTSFSSVAQTFFGIVVESSKGGQRADYVVSALDTKTGTMKDGTKAEYVILKKADDQAVVISIHPSIAKKLFKSGESDQYKIKPVTTEQVQEIAQLIDQAEKPAELSKKERALLIFADVAANGGARKQTIERFVNELGMSAPGASTYYQNCKHLWK